MALLKTEISAPGQAEAKLPGLLSAGSSCFVLGPAGGSRLCVFWKMDHFAL